MPLIPYIVDCDGRKMLSAEKRRWLYRLAEAATTIGAVDHNIPLRCLWNRYFWCEGYKVRGLFWHNERGADLFLACGAAETKIVSTIAHEIVHYEQWCDGREMDEGEAEAKEKDVAKYLARLL
jgi:hypothetical protein